MDIEREPMHNISNTYSLRKHKKVNYSEQFEKRKGRNKLSIPNKRKLFPTSTTTTVQEPSSKRLKFLPINKTSFTRLKNKSLTTTQHKRAQQQYQKKQSKINRCKVFYDEICEDIIGLYKFKVISRSEWKHNRKYEMLKLWYFVMITTECGNTDAYEYVGLFFGVSTPTIIKYLNEYKIDDTIKESLRGKHAKIQPAFTEELDIKLCEHIDGIIKSKRHFDLDIITKYVNEKLLNDRVMERGNYSKEFVRLRMRKLGYKWGKHSKGMYVDGHEREDVVQDRENFVNEMNLIRKDAYFENGETVIDKEAWLKDRIERNQVTYIVYYHDEIMFYKFYHHSHGWYSSTCRPLLPKSKGTAYNVSGFISAWDSPIIKFNDGRVIRVIHECGDPNRSGNQYNWTSEHMVNQVDEFMDWFAEKFHQNPAHIE